MLHGTSERRANAARGEDDVARDPAEAQDKLGGGAAETTLIQSGPGPNFGLPWGWTDPRTGRLGFRVSF
jgi:hypothetical protein